jgi:hypothetical protein
MLKIIIREKEQLRIIFINKLVALGKSVGAEE